MNISQGEHGGNGESVMVVNQSLRLAGGPSIYGAKPWRLLQKIIIHI
jgi:hypothetical protein